MVCPRRTPNSHRFRIPTDSGERKDNDDGEHHGGDGVNNDIPLVAEIKPFRQVTDGTSSKEPEDAVVVAYSSDDTISDD